MREQAGSFLDLCYAPKLAAEVTLQPLRRFDLDAAILFSDILVVPHAMGLPLKFVESEGPVLGTIGSDADVRQLKTDGGFAEFDTVAATVGLVKQKLTKQQTMIGFCGAPWTVASYMIEGRGSNRAKALAVARERPPWFRDLMAKLVEVSVGYLEQQIEAGAEVVQIFDSWAGDLPPDLRDELVIAPIKLMIEAVRSAHPNFPVIVFARGFGAGHADVARVTGANAVSIEQDIAAKTVFELLPPGVGLQGNLDPKLLVGDVRAMELAVEELLGGVPMARHIFNLGHGITPDVLPERVEQLVGQIRNFDRAAA